MNTLEILLSRRWIIKEQNKELYYKIKDEIGQYRRFITEKLGYSVMINPYLIRLEKIPAVPEAWMGITSFLERREYEFLCLVLMYLEDKDPGDQFILSQLTEYIQVTDQYEPVDWTHFHTRKCLIRVMKFCIENGMIKINDGNEDDFAMDYEKDVLYENMGTSRYFMRNFIQSIDNYNGLADFCNSEWLGMDEERGIIRRQRVYRSLVMGMALYRGTENEEDYAYIKNYRNMVEEELNTMFDCELQVHKTSAYLVLGESCGLGRGFPEGNGMSDILLLCCGLLREMTEAGQLPVQADDSVELEALRFQKMLEECKLRYGAGFIKQYREKTTGEFVRLVQTELERLEWIKWDTLRQNVKIKPIMGKVIGTYPKDYLTGGSRDE